MLRSRPLPALSPAEAGREQARREGTGGPATARHVTAGTNGAGGPGHAASAGPGPGQPPPAARLPRHPPHGTAWHEWGTAALFYA